MQLLHELKRRARHAVAPVLGIGIFGYFAFHAIEGDRGLFAYFRLKDQIVEAEQMQREVATIRAELEQRVSLLRPDHTDPDRAARHARSKGGCRPAALAPGRTIENGDFHCPST